ncbi:PstS family phosphate ABC transporter substrate-binding protein [Magnetospirillum gryphiswaldense]|uniref:ABC-type phosphate transport system n=1 Tax=Magnetospirillum gryphiswaldense TaxID=55518 RepID=A4U2I8_9PROT|nr:PstS family phosphate ABC transporter substrate-binding protein [Magnetospirillum gryphiswaldense]AVM74151.1 Phosphate-binding protein PstS precursor [Magnetospirillum gryphiswaldense MSR-1]AVM78054.1 Phosphate-binding protein PstS precursor [Magnetospirillum gryphiswaldense]CAM77095.1 ABC-type phosphate transport system [Magnetospirillum gryphiswaldense MSR-1]
MRKTLAVAAVALATVSFAGAAQARDQIRVVGSSTVYPFTTAVAEQFGKAGKFKTPVVESTGTGGGFKLFCAGVGPDHPDLTNASRAIKKSEMESCAKNGVTDVVEMKVGYDGIVLAASKKAKHIDVTRKQLFLALAKEVPVNGKLVENPYTTWNQIDPSLPASKIEVLGPPPTSGTRDAFLELVMESGAEAFPEIKELKKTDEKAFKKVFSSIREDGAYVEAGENDNLIVQKLDANANAFGIFGYSFLDQNSDKLQGSMVDGVAPTFEAIAAGKYPVSRPLFVYAKKAHVGQIPGIKEYLAEYTSEKAWGKSGYLADKGLIPMPDSERKEWAAKINGLEALKM